MIIRIYRGTVFPGKEHAWQNRVEQLSIPWPKSQPGLIAFLSGQTNACEWQPHLLHGYGLGQR
jgi:hypothetical protein